MRAASGSTASRRATTSALYGRVTLKPARSSAGSASQKAPRSSTDQGTSTASRPASANARLCSAGERLRETSLPSTPRRACRGRDRPRAVDLVERARVELAGRRLAPGAVDGVGPGRAVAAGQHARRACPSGPMASAISGPVPSLRTRAAKREQARDVRERPRRDDDLRDRRTRARTSRRRARRGRRACPSRSWWDSTSRSPAAATTSPSPRPCSTSTWSKPRRSPASSVSRARGVARRRGARPARTRGRSGAAAAALPRAGRRGRPTDSRSARTSKRSARGASSAMRRERRRRVPFRRA